MKSIFYLILFLLTYSAVRAQSIKIKEPVQFLALGDSYTIGQSVAVNERWPEQFFDELTRLSYSVAELKIIAQTGWRTDNLKNAINQQMPLNGYNLVSLLIGVNNQYQGGNIQTYAKEFEELLNQAIALAGYDRSHVFVLSIPDYAYTPFGNGNPNISIQIDQFNNINRTITENYNVKYIDITPISRNGLTMPALVASDGLHPSGLMYSLWVEEIIRHIERELSIDEFPDPNKSITFTLSDRQLTFSSISQASEIHIFNAAGVLVRKRNQPENSSATINLNDLAAGIYFVRIITESSQAFSWKIMLI
ncbi:MAG: hypothetical protein FD170_2990 [Bacteroidetes bacterium]|nr:MAG: hypothetical protein FD170_2990 [Bacteroidota bacterium]